MQDEKAAARDTRMTAYESSGDDRAIISNPAEKANASKTASRNRSTRPVTGVRYL